MNTDAGSVSGLHPSPRRTQLIEIAREPLDEDFVTVIVPVRNEAAFIAQCLSSILGQDEPRLEILVVDGDSEDETVAIVEQLATADDRIRLLHNPERIVPVALNRALVEARGAWLVRVDGHATVPSDYVGRAVAHLRSGGWGGVGGRKDGVGITPAGMAIATAMRSRFGVGTGSTYHHGTTLQVVEHIPFGAYPTRLARELGGWDEDLVTNQDYEFDVRVRGSGHELLFDPALRIDWYCRQSLPSLYRQYQRYGRGKADVIARHPASARPRQVLPAALVMGLAAGALLASGRRTRRLGLVALLSYPAAVAAASAAAAGDVPTWSARLRLPAAFAAMHLGWGAGLLRGAAALAQARRCPAVGT